MAEIATFDKPTSSFGSFKGFGTSATPDLNDPKNLLKLAQLQGGSVAEAAEEMMHPERSILSSIGEGFKNAFKGMLDVLMTPSEIMAGVISPDMSIREAMKEDIMPSDVLFGEPDADRTTMQKVGGFLVRTATDILFDPLTYLTFGAAQGILGLRGATKVTLVDQAAKNVGVRAGFSKALNRSGQDLFKFLKGVENQALGKETIQAITKGNKIFGLAKKELDDVLRMTIDSPLRIDSTKRAITNLLKNKPSLTKELLDKGGIKFFSKTILSGQRIGSATKMIPGFTHLDNMMKNVTRPVQALFDPKLIKAEGKYIRLPEEFIDLETASRELAISLGDTRLKDLGRIARQNKITTNEANFLTSAVEANKIPSDKRLADVYLQLKKFSKDEFDLIKKAGVPISYIDNHFPHVLVENADIGVIPFKTSPSIKSPAAAPAKIAKFAEAKPHIIAGKFNKDLIPDIVGKQKFAQNLRNVSTIDEAVIETGRFTDEFIEKARNAGKSMDEILDSNEIEQLRKFRESIEKMEEGASNLVGQVDDLGLKPLEDRAGLFVDKAGKVYERVRATIDDIKEMGFEGFDENIITGLAKRSVQNTRTYTMNNFVNSLVHHMGMNADEAPDAWRTISSRAVKEHAKGITEKQAARLTSSIISTEGEDIVFHPAIAKRVEEFVGATLNDDAISDFFKGFDKIQNLWKASVTSIFPAFHGRNAISNVFLHFMDLGVESLNPRTHGVAGDLLARDIRANRLSGIAARAGKKGDAARNKLNKLLETKVFKDGSGYEWTFGELRSVVRNKGVAFRSDILGQIDVRETSTQVIKSFFSHEEKFVRKALRKGLPFTQDFWLFKGGKRIGRMVEEHARLTDFIANLRKSGNVGLAAQRSKQFLFDYTYLTPFEKTFMKRVIPFYCVPEESEILTKGGWKHYDDLRIGEIVLTLNKETLKYEWQSVKDIAVFEHDQPLMTYKNRSYKIKFTPNHRWVVRDYKGNTTVKEGQELNTGDSIITSAKLDSKESSLSPEQARLLGWLLTDGYWRWRGNYCEAVIYQHPKKFLKEVEEVAGGTPRKPHPDSGVVAVPVLNERVKEIKHLLTRDKRKNNWIDIVTSLSTESAEAMYDAMYKADGNTKENSQKYFACELKGVADTFEILATLLGYRVRKSARGYYISNFQTLGIKKDNQGSRLGWEHYTGKVWCPKTDNGTWVMRQNGFITATHNTFTRKNLELQVKSLFRDPGRVAAEFHGLTNIGDIIMGGSLSEDERKNLPDWLKDGMTFLADRRGSTVDVIGSFGTPTEQTFQAIQPNAALGAISPLLRVPVELATGHHFFYGKQLQDVTNAAAFRNAPSTIKDFIGFTKVTGKNKETGEEFEWDVSLRPERMHVLLNLPPTSRVLSAMKQMGNQKVDKQWRTIQQLVGIRPFQVDLKREADRKEREMKDDLQKLLQDADIIAKFERAWVPEK